MKRTTLQPPRSHQTLRQTNAEIRRTWDPDETPSSSLIPHTSSFSLLSDALPLHPKTKCLPDSMAKSVLFIPHPSAFSLQILFNCQIITDKNDACSEAPPLVRLQGVVYRLSGTCQ